MDIYLACFFYLIMIKHKLYLDISAHFIIMRPVIIHHDAIKSLLKQQKVVTLDEIKNALGTKSSATAYRKRAELKYLSSYSHGSRFYTLNNIVRFNKQGLWSFNSVCFSVHGTLLATLEHLISTAEEGLFANQLKDMLHVDVNTSLTKRFKLNTVSREKLLGHSLYCSTESEIKKGQMAKRQASMAGQSTRAIVMGDHWVDDEIKAAIILFVSLLDEKQRRLFAGLESMQFGHGGDKWIAELVSFDPHTVAKGRRQLLARDIQFEGVSASGAGRPEVKKTAQTSSKK
jgi:hypothetical protein